MDVEEGYSRAVAILSIGSASMLSVWTCSDFVSRKYPNTTGSGC